MASALEIVGLGDRAKGKAKVYSGSMKRRLNLACRTPIRDKRLAM